MKLLAVECSAGPVSVALTEDGQVIGSCFLHRAVTHSVTLMPMIEHLLSATGLSLAEIDGFAVAAGPGSFTGIRIGVSAVKGMAFPEDKPCCPVSPLEAMAYSFLGEDAVVCGMMDARCSQVYHALFRVKGGEVTRLTEDRALSLDDLKRELEAGCFEVPVYLAGDGAHLLADAVWQKTAPILAPEHRRYQNAVGVALAAEPRFRRGETVSASRLQPVYLRLPQAERELAAKKGE